MEILSSRVLLRPVDLPATQGFYRDVLGLAVAREFGPAGHRGVVFFLGNGLLEVSGTREAGTASTLVLWVQVRDVQAELLRLAGRGITIDREALTEPWGLIEGWIRDPDGTRIVLVQVPADHPIRRDIREP
ncbi:glyoxalase [Arthrobacter sp. UCD-GKA]|uniref:VOC family protein n=1 Tax=Arthrobacter sp. UCD-GKA TaxID=1913576 RepID=UPI0008DE14D6|nr:VOC family protein [Arthrobacter sp. UCD-GKA]OIH82029.1 glyoxalase [Arthrobacter sp. UCD-GKA]